MSGTGHAIRIASGKASTVQRGEEHMPVRIIGMIGVAPPSGEATVHIIKGGISAPYLKSYAQAHDKAGFDLALVGYTASSAEGFLVAQYAAHHTERLGFLIAHRPGFVPPTSAARPPSTCRSGRFSAPPRGRPGIAPGASWPRSRSPAIRRASATTRS